MSIISLTRRARWGNINDMWYTPLFNQEAWVTQYYGLTKFASESGRYSRGIHRGLDLRVDDRKSWELLACIDGHVMEVGNHDKYGINITIYNEKLGVSLRFAHLEMSAVRKGDRIRIGGQLGICGNTGNSAGTHLHIGMIPMRPYGVVTFGDNPDGGTVDPLGFLLGIGVHI